jgi:hypothetical protein
MDDGESPEITAAVATLARGDVSAASDAAAALFWITGGRSPANISQELVQDFCWHDLPRYWDTGFGRGIQVTEALARALELLELPRYAAICRSPVTRGILAAYENGSGVGRAAFRRAAAASGIVPPDLPGLRWGVRMGLVEASAWTSAAEHLELGVASGELIPGAHGWKARQKELTREYLDARHGGGQSLRQAIVAERLEIWASARQSRTRRVILTGIRDRLLLPPGLQSAGEDPLGKLRWLLEEMDNGIPLTRAGYLHPEVVRRAANRFGIAGPREPRTETQLPDLVEIRRFAQRLGLVRRSGARLVLTAAGRRLSKRPTALWQHAGAKLLGGTDFTAFTGELFLALAVGSHSLSIENVCATVTSAVHEEHFRDTRTCELPTSYDVRHALARTTGPMHALDMFNRPGARGGLLTPAGEAMALEALQSRAAGPVAVPR